MTLKLLLSMHIINDIFDIEFDKSQPRMKIRPVSIRIISMNKTLIIFNNDIN